ncbi:hypothetical protein AVEN_238431-1 [Araneus ventricosus]|uniref:Uncharacterized protein n=1 Tax=Araneus ventricosus TaxID=182803 RepID=A0A4Y2M696_ARAVE|nr:hypothetical protein AVEN_238431-1 [Araneus ventricosus]
MWTSGWFDKKICFCKPGYAQRKDTCVACECGPDSNCTFSGLLSQKKCICKPGYWEVDGKCVGSSREGICISVRGSFAMLDFEIIFLKSLDPASYLAFRFSKIQKPSKGSMISPEKKFPSI